MQQRFDLIVVGAGMVGSALACALADSGLKLALLDAQSLQPVPEPLSTSGYDPRVSALSAASEQILRRLGAWQQIPSSRRCAYRHMCVWDAEGTGEVRFDARSLNELRLGHIVENWQVQNARTRADEGCRAPPNSVLTLVVVVACTVGFELVRGMLRQEVEHYVNSALLQKLDCGRPLLLPGQGCREEVQRRV